MSGLHNLDHHKIKSAELEDAGWEQPRLCKPPLLLRNKWTRGNKTYHLEVVIVGRRGRLQVS